MTGWWMMHFDFFVRLCSDKGEVQGFCMSMIRFLSRPTASNVCFYCSKSCEINSALEVSKTNRNQCHRKAWVPRREAWGDHCTFGVWSQSLWWVPKLPLGQTLLDLCLIFPLQAKCFHQPNETDLSSPTGCVNEQFQIRCTYEQHHLTSYRIKATTST